MATNPSPSLRNGASDVDDDARGAKTESSSSSISGLLLDSRRAMTMRRQIGKKDSFKNNSRSFPIGEKFPENKNVFQFLNS